MKSHDLEIRNIDHLKRKLTKTDLAIFQSFMRMDASTTEFGKKKKKKAKKKTVKSPFFMNKVPEV